MNENNSSIQNYLANRLPKNYRIVQSESKRDNRDKKELMKIEKEENKMITDPCKDKKRAPEKKVALDAAIVYQA